jgi:hypothetical protein
MMMMKDIKLMHLEYLILRKKHKKVLNKALIQNFIYGCLFGLVPTFISTGVDIAIIVSVLCYSSFLSIVLNRDKYKTKFGRHILFPGMYTLGAYTGFKIAEIISVLIQ